MLKYLIIQLCDSAPSFCHYANGSSETLITLENLRKGVVWSMKQNVSVQVIYPIFELPEEYKNVLSFISSTSIVDAECQDKQLLLDANIIVVNDVDENKTTIQDNATLVIRINSKKLLQSADKLIPYIQKAGRINLILTDVYKLDEVFLSAYKKWLIEVSEIIKYEYLHGHMVQCNLLTDRFMLDAMNNCNAGYESVTLAPDGKFYTCPAFYFEAEKFGIFDKRSNLGDINNGLDIKNPQLYELEHAPLCRICDAYQCKRCVWMNRMMTYEVNTPSHEQCVMAHHERNASRMLLLQIQEKGIFLPNKVINEIDYLDPFDIRPKW